MWIYAESVFFPGVNSNTGTLEAETAQDYTINLPESESINQLRHLGAWVLPSQQQKNLLLFLKGQPQVLGVSGHKISAQAVGRTTPRWHWDFLMTLQFSRSLIVVDWVEPSWAAQTI